jgi:hypothetical protein
MQAVTVSAARREAAPSDGLEFWVIDDSLPINGPQAVYRK